MSIGLSNTKIPFSFFLVVSFLSGCSVHKAASNEGVHISDIKKCKHKICFLSQGMKMVNEKEETNGEYSEVYRAVAAKSGANYMRAAGHGVLDVMTLGLWEVVGTPVEGAISENRGYITAKATYKDKKSEEVTRLEIFDPTGKLVSAKG